MMDKEQLDYVLRSIPMTTDDIVLDLGCGTGSILNRIVAKYGCMGVGIDMLDGITAPHDGKTRYICGDIDRFTDYSVVPSITLSVDSLYFSSDLDKLVRKLAQIRNNRLYFFYSQYLFDEVEDKGLLQSGNTRLAQALSKAGMSFRTMDFSGNEHRLYLHMEKALSKLEHAFALDGNADLYEQKLREVRLGIELFETDCASRYLYISES